MPRFLHRVCCPSNPPFVPDAHTKIWLPGQDDAYSSTIRDRSGNGNNGTITGAQWGKNSQGIWYLDHDGSDDKIICGNTGVPTGSAARTVEMWAKVDTLLGVTARSFFAWGVYTESNIFTLQHGNGSGDLSIVTYAHNYTSTLVIVAATWYYLAATLTGTAVTITMNASTQSGTLDATPNTSSSNIYIGSRLDAANTFIDMKLALFRVHDRVLTTVERLSHYNQERSLFGV